MLELIYGNKKEAVFLNYNEYSEKYILDLKGKTYIFSDHQFPENVEELKKSRDGIEQYLEENNISDELLEDLIQETL